MTTSTAVTKEVLGVYRPGSAHRVGDGFPVWNLFPSNDLDREVSPFLLLDYAGLQDFAPTDHPSTAQADSRLLVMGGEPIEEPIARSGPFVMNTKAELVQAVEDYQAGKMGHLS